MKVESSRLRVLIQTPYASRKDVPGGVGNFIQELVPHLESKGFDIRVLGPSVKDKDNNFADHKLGKVPFSVSVNDTKFYPGFSPNKRRARRITEAFGPHLIVAHEPAVPNSAHVLISGIPRREDGKRLVPVIGQFHAQRKEGLDISTKIYEKALSYVRRPRLKFGVPVGRTKGYLETIRESLTGRIAVSNATAKFWSDHFPGKYDVIYNGIDTHGFTPDGPKFEHWNDGRKTILFTGRHDERKGLPYLIKAYEALRNHGKNVKLMITGYDKDLTPVLEQMVKERGVPDVHFLGFLSKDDLAKVYRSADLFVAPSVGGEGLNRTVIEARVSGTVVVCTNIEGQDEAIGPDFARFMAKPADSYDLSLKMNEALNLPLEERRRLSAGSRQDAIDNFSWDKIAEDHAKYYERVVDRYGIPVWSNYVLKEKTLLSRIPLLGNVFVRDELRRKT
ncbi:MAG: glycosyltransferase family 4 protein [bacterium]|nr:glycosyltransferase family 4 protein [bacterium]